MKIRLRVIAFNEDKRIKRANESLREREGRVPEGQGEGEGVVVDLVVPLKLCEEE